jgi:hypothetical protein
MAATTIGLTTVSFGLAQETGVVVQSFTRTETMETSELSDYNGTHAAVAFSNRRFNVSLSGNATTAQGTIGAALSLTANATAISVGGTHYITDSSINLTNDGFLAFDLSASNFPSLGA